MIKNYVNSSKVLYIKNKIKKSHKLNSSSKCTSAIHCPFCLYILRSSFDFSCPPMILRRFFFMILYFLYSAEKINVLLSVAQLFSVSWKHIQRLIYQNPSFTSQCWNRILRIPVAEINNTLIICVIVPKSSRWTFHFGFEFSCEGILDSKGFLNSGLYFFFWLGNIEWESKNPSYMLKFQLLHK